MQPIAVPEAFKVQRPDEERRMQAASDEEYVEYVTARLPALRRLACLLSGDQHAADDLVQRTITKLYVKWHKIRHVEHLDQYVRTILTREFISEKRRAWSRIRLLDTPPPGLPVTGLVERRGPYRAARRAGAGTASSARGAGPALPV
jgi:DNA-directed RNA polymerase specialized sigma24 family protein